MDPNDAAARTIRRNLKKARRKAKMSEADLAAATGLTVQTIKRWEGTIQPPTMPKLGDAALLIDPLGISLDELVGNEADPVARLTNVAIKVERQIEALPLMIERLLAELAEARQAAIVGHEAKLAAAVERADKKPGQQAVDA